MGVLDFRAAATALLTRYSWARQMGLTFGGARNVPAVLGYKEYGTISTQDFIERYERGGVAGRVVDVPPNATWRGELWLEENEDPDKVTPFEQAWEDLEKAHALRERFLQVDKLSRLSTYAVLLIGAPGEMDTELPRGKMEDLLYFQPYLGGGGPANGQRRTTSGMFDADASIASYDEDPKSKRFGKPATYNLKRTDFSSPGLGRPIHWTRVVHVAEGLLRDDVYGQPALERCWNYFDDLDKVVGGGSEAFWMRANAGLHMNVDKDMQIAKGAADTELAKVRQDAEEYQHQLTRIIRTRGVEINQLGSDVANFSTPADSIITLIAGSTGIPKRLLVGSEMGELASTQDRENFRDLVSGRQMNHAGPRIVRQLVDRLIEYGYLPKPAQYKVKWPNIEVLSESEKTAGAKEWASTNQAQGETVFTTDEIRDKWAGMKPLSKEQVAAEEAKKAKKLEEEQALIAAKNPPPDSKEEKEKGKFPRAAEAGDEDLVRVLAAALERNDEGLVAEIVGLDTRHLGGPGSGNFGHGGRPGQIGGSAPRTTGGGIGQPASSYPPSFAEGRDTKERYSDGKGNYTPERARLHDEIVQRMMRGTSPVASPTATILGGAPGVGKSTIVKQQGIGAENTVLVSVDEVRDFLPEYAPDANGKRPASTAFTHEEASDISAKLIKASAAGSRNIVLDGTGDSTVEKLGGKVAVLRARGQKVEATYVTTTLAISQARADSRGQKIGRMVPPSDMAHMHRQVSKIYPEAVKQGLFDRSQLFDNSDGPPKLVASSKGTELTVHDEGLWLSFLAKGAK